MRGKRLPLALALALALVGCGIDEVGGGPSNKGIDAAAPPPASFGDAGAPDGAGRGGGVVPSLAWSVVASPPDIALTQPGEIDWAHWGELATGAVRMANGSGAIGDYAAAAAACVDDHAGSWPVKASWTNGAPTATSPPNDVNHRRFFGSTGLSVGLTLPCDGAQRVFTVDLGGWSSQARFEVAFDDVSLPSRLTNDQGNLGDYYAARYTVVFSCAPPTHVLVTWTATNLQPSTSCKDSTPVLVLSSATLR